MEKIWKEYIILKKINIIKSVIWVLDNLKVDGTIFYETFFSEYSIGDSIELKKGNSVKNSNKLSIAVYDTISKLLNEIIQKIDEEKED